MSKKELKDLANRFFNNDTELCAEVNLTEAEIEAFKRFEWNVLCDNGLRNINGGWSSVVVDGEQSDDDNDYLICNVECGSGDDTGGNKSWWPVKFNRKTLKFEGGGEE